MRDRHSKLAAALSVLLAGCTSAAARDLEKCVAAGERGAYAAGIYACELAVSKDPNGATGRAAKARIVVLQAAETERLAVDAGPLKPGKVPRSQQGVDEEALDEEAHSFGATKSRGCELMCFDILTQCNLFETRSGSPKPDFGCYPALDRCLASCAADAGPQ